MRRNKRDDDDEDEEAEICSFHSCFLFNAISTSSLQQPAPTQAQHEDMEKTHIGHAERGAVQHDSFPYAGSLSDEVL